jgi:hypothetical protein
MVSNLQHIADKNKHQPAYPATYNFLIIYVAQILTHMDKKGVSDMYVSVQCKGVRDMYIFIQCKGVRGMYVSVQCKRGSVTCTYPFNVNYTIGFTVFTFSQFSGTLTFL